MSKSLGLIGALALGFLVFYLTTATPAPAPADAPASAFSAARAMEDIRAIGSVPHPVGSPANAKVRDYLLGRLQALGLSVQVQRGSSFEVFGSRISGAAVENIIGILPGRDRSAPALVLMAHHDSVPGSPGAADDSAGVASALEIVRAITAKGAPARDVMVVVTDGEEAGLLGARVFFDDSPLAKHVGYVINMETRGGGGRAAMFETGVNNGGDIALYRRTAQMPDSNALTVFVYKHLPNDTDFTVVKQHGKVGLNYAFIGRQFDYHSPSSTPAALDVGALQHMGAQILPTAVALAFGPLPARAPDAVYSDLFGLVVVAYPTWFGWILLVGAAALMLTGAYRAQRRNQLSAGDVLRGLGASLYVIAFSGAVLELARRATGVGSGWISYRPILARFPIFELMMLAAALGAVLAAAAFSARGRIRWGAAGSVLIVGLASSLFAGVDQVGLILGVVGAVIGAITFGASARLAGSWTGLLIVTLIVACVIQGLAPTAAFIPAWPLLAAALAAAISAAGADRRVWARLAVVAIATLVFAWLGGLFHSMLQGLDLPPLAIVPAWLAALMIWPLAFTGAPEQNRLWPSGTLVATALVLAGWLHLTSPWTPRHPNAAEPIYVVDPAMHQAWRASLTPPDTWVRTVLAGEGGRKVSLDLPFLAGPIAASIASPTAVEPASTSLVTGVDGQTTLKVGPSAGAARVIVSLSSAAAITQVTVNGRPAIDTPRDGKPAAYTTKAGQWARITWAGPDGFTMGFHTDDPSSVRIRTAEVYDRWMAAKPLPPMPATDQAWDMAGSTLVLGGTAEGRKL
jgi:hypothetical protein